MLHTIQLSRANATQFQKIYDISDLFLAKCCSIFHSWHEIMKNIVIYGRIPAILVIFSFFWYANLVRKQLIPHCGLKFEKKVWLKLNWVYSSWLNLNGHKWVLELIGINLTQMNPWMNFKQKLFWNTVHFQRLFKGPGISEISFLKKAMYGFFLWSIYCLQHHNMTGIDCRKKYHPWSLQGNINYVGK